MIVQEVSLPTIYGLCDKVSHGILPPLSPKRDSGTSSKHQHHLGICKKCTFSGPFQTCWVRKPGTGAHKLCFGKPSQWLQHMLILEVGTWTKLLHWPRVHSLHLGPSWCCTFYGFVFIWHESTITVLNNVFTECVHCPKNSQCSTSSYPSVHKLLATTDVFVLPFPRTLEPHTYVALSYLLI